jgi:hypothetical protein
MPMRDPQDVVTLKNDRVRVQVARQFGPRIVSLQLDEGTNLFAELPGVSSQRPDGKTYLYHGGHRLWVAPEDPIRSYALDDILMEVTPDANGVLVRKPVEQETGLEKFIQVVLANSAAKLTITHRLTNKGSAAVDCAPWAITQLKPGGVAILPQAATPSGLLPNRVLSFWPYANISSPHILWGNRYILLRAEKQPPFKIGFPNPRGWLGYWLEGILFVKRAPFFAQADYCDFGSSSECYCDQEFIELETLAPVGRLDPGGSVVHIEIWELHANVDYPKDEDSVQRIVDRIGLYD